MALENIWIIDSTSGICIYDWYVSERKRTIDEQLVSGLLIAFKNFSSEAGLVDISAIEGIDKKLAYKSDDRFIIAGVCHMRDYETLVNKTLLNMLSTFRTKYKKLLDQGLTTDVSPFRTFDEDINNALEGKSASRNVTTTIVGIMFALVVASITFTGYYFAMNAFSTFGLSNDVVNFLGLIVILLGMMIAGVIGGAIAGDRRLGMIAGVITTIPIIILMVIFFQGGWGSSVDIFSKVVFGLLYFILFGTTATLGGLFGGYIRENKFFYPLEEEVENEETEPLAN